MTALDLPAIRALLAGATPGPWEWDDEIRRGLWRAGESTPVLGCGALLHPGKADAAFIAAAPSIVTQLLAKVEAGLAACEAVIDNTDGHKPPGPPHPSREQATAMRIRAALTEGG